MSDEIIQSTGLIPGQEPTGTIQPAGSFSQELSLDRLTTELYIARAVKAVNGLGWQLASILNNTIICHTNGIGNSLGESVTISVTTDKVIFTSKAMNEYYTHDGRNEANCAQFVAAMATIAKHEEEVERRTSPLLREQYGALVPSKTYLVTPLLIYINIAVFICMVISGVSIMSPAVPALFNWGGNFRSAVLDGQAWRLFTSMFLHGGIAHLLMNMYALLYIGIMLEPLLGKFRFGAAYLLSGICGSLLSITFHAYSVGVGASGAIFGLYGVFLSMLTTNHIQKTARKTLLRSILFFVVFNLMYGMQGNTDNAAHIGGLLGGLAIGYIYFPGISSKHDIKRQLITTSVLTLSVIALTVFSMFTLKDDIAIYQQKMQKFADMESMALEVFKMKSDSKKEDVLYYIKDRGNYYWNEDIKIIKDVQQLDLPPNVQEKNKKLLAYCNLRIKMYDLMYDQLTNDNNAHENEINEYRVQIEELLNTLKEK